jgi:hypothetical protein
MEKEPTIEKSNWRELRINSIGNTALNRVVEINPTAEQMLENYLARGGNDEGYIRYLKGIDRDPRD